MRRSHRIWTTLLATLLCVASVFAQSNTGSIAGRAMDPAHKPVANAQILITNTDLNVKRTIVTDAAGAYRASGLAPGAYTVEASAPNLKSRRPERVTLGLGSSVRVDLALAIPVVRQGTSVNARGRTSEGNTLAPPVNKDEADVSSFFTGNTVTYLPNRDRDFTQFGQLGGGIVEDTSENGLVVAGQRSTAVITQVDGVSYNDPLHGGRRGASDGAFPAAADYGPRVPDRALRRYRGGRRHQRRADQRSHQGGVRTTCARRPSTRFVLPGRQPPTPSATRSKIVRTPSALRPATRCVKDRFFYYAGFEQDFLQSPFYTLFAPQTAGTTLPASLSALQGQVIQRHTPGAISLRGDWALSEANTLNLELAVNRVRGSNLGDGSSRSLATASHSDSLSGQSVFSKAGLTSLLGKRSVNQFVVAWSGDHRNLMPNSTAPEIDINGFGTLGGDALGPHLYTSQQLQLIDTVTITHGSALLSLGGNFDNDPAYERQEANLNGRFDFSSFAAYQGQSAATFPANVCHGQHEVPGLGPHSGSVRQCQAAAQPAAYADCRAALGRAVQPTDCGAVYPPDSK